jgi:phosphoribosyl 1,2-cyclic phosphodiesterase
MLFIRFHGVRGSTPVCGPHVWRYGGNTACVELRTPALHRIFIDAGTGVRRLAHAPSLGDEAPIHAAWLISHYHWDHIQGLPFFAPLYDPQNRFDFFGLPPHGGGCMEAALQGQLRPPYFPSPAAPLAAACTYRETPAGQRWHIGDAVIEAARLHHPQGCLGFRIETPAGTVAYVSDTEPSDPTGDRAARRLAREADVLIHDAQYSPEQLARRQGWGHSSWVEAVRVARDAGARCLLLAHHDPDADDDHISRVVEMARTEWPETWGAGEDLEVTCRTPGVHVDRRLPRLNLRVPHGRVLLRGRDRQGQPVELDAMVASLSVSAAYLIVPHWTFVHPDVEVTFLDADPPGSAILGHVLHLQLDPLTRRPAACVAFAPGLTESWQAARPAMRRHASEPVS